jgi:hypothetical protein
MNVVAVTSSEKEEDVETAAAPAAAVYALSPPEHT